MVKRQHVVIMKQTNASECAGESASVLASVYSAVDELLPTVCFIYCMHAGNGKLLTYMNATWTVPAYPTSRVGMLYSVVLPS